MCKKSQGRCFGRDALVRAAAKREEIRTRLAEIDAASIRPLRAVAEGTAVQADTAELAELDSEAAALRTELAGLSQAG
jgi:hypothetical protein